MNPARGWDLQSQSVEGTSCPRYPTLIRLRHHPFPAMPRIALLQSSTFATKEDAFDHHEALIRRAAAEGAHIVVTQELFLTP